MVKGNTSSRLNPKASEAQPCADGSLEAAAAMAAAARPPLSALSGGVRNNLASGANATTLSSNAQAAKSEKPSPRAGTKTSYARAGVASAAANHDQGKYPHLENSSFRINCNNVCSTPTPARMTPDRFVTPSAMTTTSNRSTQSAPRRASWVPTPPKAAKNLEASRRSSFAGTIRHNVARALSNSFATEENIDVENSSSSSSSCTSELSDPESIKSSVSQTISSVHHHQKAAGRTQRFSSSSSSATRHEFPTSNSAGLEFQRTPNRANSKPWRTGSCSAAAASPSNIRSMISAGTLHRGGSGSQQLHISKSLSQNFVEMDFELEEDSSFWNDHNVQVLVRMRPLSSIEAANQEFLKCLRQESAHTVTWLGQPESQFTFDHVAGEKISQEKLFNVVGLPMVENCMAGYNSCMFAYGQTGSGKTHTMLGDIDDLFHQPSDNRGITPRIFEYLFARILKEEEERKLEHLQYVCKCSFLEIYNEQITDLLEPTSSNLQIREDCNSGVYVENLSEVEVKSMQDVVHLLLKGAGNRRVAATHMNAESSRSHSVFACTIESRWENNSLINMRFGRLNLVDLAGSERQKNSGAEGERLKEAANINKSLSTLGLVIMILVDVANGKQRHVPYRDSKLTYLLQDSLGGNSKTAIIATVSPSSCCAMETLSTLKFAQRAKFIQNNAIINEDASGEMTALRREIQRLKEELSSLRSQTLSSMRRERRRESDEFFRLSITPKAIFSPAPEDVHEDEPTLKTEELLEKVLQSHGMFLRQEEETESCRKVVQLREDKIQRLELLSDEKLSVESYLNDENKMLAQELQIMQGFIKCNPKLAHLSMDNLHLTEQLKRYQEFYEAGERETLLQENLDLRNQMLELLNGKIAVDQGPGALVNTEAEHCQKELEICRNDLTTCLEASAQVQRQLNETETLVGQLTLQCAELQKELVLLKEDREDLNSRYQKIVEEKDQEIGRTQLEWEVAAKKLLMELAEGDKILIEAEQEMEEIISETWLLKSLHNKAQRWSAESKQSEADVDKEQEYFGTGQLFEENEIFTSQLQIPGPQDACVAFGEEKIRLESKIQQLEQELQDWQQRTQTAQALSAKLEALQKCLTGLDREKSAMEVEIELLQVRAQEASTLCEDNVKLVNKAQNLELELLECQSKNAEEISFLLEAKDNLHERVKHLELELKDCQQRAEETQTTLVEMAKDNLELREEIELLSNQAQQATGLLEEKHKLEREMVELELELKDSHRKKLALRKETKQLASSLVEMECQNQSLALAVEQEAGTSLQMKKDMLVLKEEKEALQHFVENLQQELKNCQQKAETTALVHEELRRTVVSLHSELGQKVELEADAATMAQSLYDKLKTNNVELDMLVQRNFELERDLALKIGALEVLAEELADANKSKQNVESERDELAEQIAALLATGALMSKQVQELQEELHKMGALMSEQVQELQDELHKTGALMSKQVRELQEELDKAVVLMSKQVQELQEKLDEKSNELQSISVDMSAQISHFQGMATSLVQELEEKKIAFVKLQDELHSVKQELAHLIENSENELCAALETEEKLQTELSNVTEELTNAQVLAGENKRMADHVRQESEDRALLISALQENKEKLQGNMEMLQEELLHKEELVQRLELDIRELQHVAEDSHLQEELLYANSQILELKTEVEQKIKACSLLEEELIMTRTAAAKVAQERDDLRFTSENCQEKLSILETEVAVGCEALCKMETELTVAKAASAQVTEELGLKIKELGALEVNLLAVQASTACAAKESNDLKAQVTSLASKVEFLEAELQLKAEAMSLLEVELMTATLAATDMTEESIGLKAQNADLEASKIALAAELEQNVSTKYSLEGELKAARANASTLTEQNLRLETELLAASLAAIDLREKIAELETQTAGLEASKVALTAELEQDVDARCSLEAELKAARITASDLIEQNLTLTAQVAELHVKLVISEKDLEQKFAALSSLESELVGERLMVTCMTEESSKFQIQIAELEKKVEAARFLQNELTTATVAVCHLTEKSSKFEAQIAELQAKNCALNTDLQHQLEELRAMEGELKAVRMTASNTTEENARLNVQVAELQAKKVASEGELEQKAATQILLESEVEAARLTVSCMEGELKAARMTASNMTEEIIRLNGQVAELQAKKVSSEGELEQKAAVQIILEGEVEAARLAVSYMEGELRAERITASNMTEENARLNAQVAELQMKKVAAEGELEQKTAAQILLEGQVEAARLAVSQMEGELRAARITASNMTEENARLNAQVAELQVKKVAAEGELEQKNAAQILLEGQVEAARLAVSQMEGELRAVRMTASNMTEEIVRLNGQVAELQAKKVSSEWEFEQKAAAQILLEGEVVAARLAVSQMEGELRAARMTASNMTEEIVRLNGQVAELQARKVSSEGELEHKAAAQIILEGEVVGARLAISHMEGELRAARMAASNMTEENTRLNAQVAELEAIKANAECELEQKVAAQILLERELVAAKFTASHMENEFRAARITAFDMTEENDRLNAQVAELQAKKVALEVELDHRVATQIRLEDECPKLKAQIAVLEKKVEAMRSLELRIGMLEEELNAKEDAIESLEKQHLAAVQQKETLLENAEQNLITMKSDRDRVCTELQSLHEELVTLQSRADYHEAAALEAQKNAELNERCLKDKEEESRLLQTSVEALQSTLSALENQLDLLKRESEQQRMMREDLELDLEGMRNHMSMMHALRSTDAWNAQSFQTAQSTNAELQRQMDEKDKELDHVRKKLESLHCQCDDYTRKIEDMEADLTHVQQEILALRIECEHKDKQISTLNVQLADAESLTQDVMRDLHSVKLDISNYASLVSQQQLELISERARHFDEAQEKDEEVSNLRAQLNKERESWMLEMHHKQAEIVVSRVLSEKLLLKNKTLANEYKKLKADHAGKRKQLQLLEEELKQLTELQSCTESETEDFDEVKQFQALLACANANDELPQNQA
ncbi:unnamed protein product [Sphagnum jensenii]|uniref:Kinesin motor domain-containing protein n=1 Tax=Sphagnum jensenii TaxID=128206 RepID=A0ABP0WFD7_9BRYO